MSTKRESIIAAAIAGLTGVTGVTNASIFRSRVTAFARREFPAITVEPINDTPDNPNIHRLEWTLVFHAALMFRAETADQTADPTIADVHSKIMGNSTLLALVTDLQPGSVDWQFTEADVVMCVITMQFIAKYQTDLNTI